MKINFDLRNTGLGNNGGSDTLVKSMNVLIELGHEISIIDSGPICYTWDEVKASHIIVKNVYNEIKIPDADWTIATGMKSVKPTLSLPSRCGKKGVWVRAWETWQYSSEIIFELLSTKNLNVFVNSQSLKRKLSQKRINSRVIYPGFNFESIYQTTRREIKKEITIGGLLNFRHLTKRSDWVLLTFEYLKEKFTNTNKNLKFKVLTSSKNNIRDKFAIDHICLNPTIHEKREFYNSIDIWLAPTCNEGLHRPPAEAALTGCCIVMTNNPNNGMWDYLNSSNSIITDDDLLSFQRSVEKIINNPKQIIELGKLAQKSVREIGSRKYNMKKFTEVLSKI